ncbi:MAG: transcriptional repressor [Myxococcales bacterium]|nr:MAG: transcriptional repressor [Myxococcales bacterium]
METEREEVRRRIERFTETCRSARVKLTMQRLEIFREVAKSGEHPDAEAIHRGVRKRLPTVSLDTVYRTLWLLVDLGLISAVGLSRERVRFDANMSPHHHFVCTECGLARDFHHPAFDALPPPKDVAAMGFVRTAHVELRGLCSRCAQRKERNRTSRKTK